MALSKKGYPYLYIHSWREAERSGELPMWTESHQENKACKEAIEDAIRRNFNGRHLKDKALTEVLDKFGFKRTEYVLAATLRLLSHDGRFHRDNTEWADRHQFYEEKERLQDYVVTSHPAVLDGFVNMYRCAYDAHHLFSEQDCDTTIKELKGHVLVVKPAELEERYWSQDNQLWVATGGNGCSENSRGRAVFAICLGDKDEARWNRSDFLGVIKEDRLPEWAKSRLAEIQQGQAKASAMDITM